MPKSKGPEDVVVDRQGNLYCGNRYGDVVRFFGPDHKKWEIFAHIGGGPLGLAFDRDDNLIVCVSGMGLYKVSPQKEVTKLTDETNRSWLSIIDNSRMRFADDLDIVPDGRIFFSEATIRFDITEWAVDALEARGNGRIICYDPRDKSTRTVIPNLQFPNGICMHLRRRVDPVCRDLGLPRPALLVRRAEGRQARDRSRKPAGLSRQHQPRLGRQLLGGAGRHARAGLRSRLAHARLPPPHGATASRMTNGSTRT